MNTETIIEEVIKGLSKDKNLRDEFIDKQLLFLIIQNNNLSIKLGAIKEYNRLENRINSNENNNKGDFLAFLKKIEEEDKEEK